MEGGGTLVKGEGGLSEGRDKVDRGIWSRGGI